MTTNPELAPDMPKQIWANDSGRKEDGSCNTGTWSAFDTPRAGPYATPSSAPQKYKRTPYIRADLAPQAGSVDVDDELAAVLKKLYAEELITLTPDIDPIYVALWLEIKEKFPTGEKQ